MAAAVESKTGEQPISVWSKNGGAPSSAPAEQKAIIDIRDITKVYKMGDVEVQALRGVTLKVYEAEFISIMGPSGSGKSTMLNIIGALDQPTSGEYYLDGVDVSKMTDNQLAGIRNKKIGFVFQNFNLLARTTALRQVELPLLYAGTPNRSKLAQAALEAVGLGNRMNHLPTELSGGQQQRVAIARAMVTNPAIVLADEPTGALDSHSGQEILKIFQQLNRERRMTIVFVTHDAFVARHTNRIVMLRDGQIVADHRVPNPYDAATTERPTDDAELEMVFKENYPDPKEQTPS
ncbi:MAG TPA: ABC transporter ATP-binding protein [Aggregatilineales bacterium]|nr:ABC transporter ATP-binding protein [Aggregatilineales bacterium]